LVEDPGGSRRVFAWLASTQGENNLAVMPPSRDARPRSFEIGNPPEGPRSNPCTTPFAFQYAPVVAHHGILHNTSRNLSILLKTNTQRYSLSSIAAASVLSSRRGMKSIPNPILYATPCNIPSRNRFGRPDSRTPPPPAPSPNGFAFLAGDDSKGLSGFVRRKRPHRTRQSAPLGSNHRR
jgi:hypothetical protein